MNTGHHGVLARFFMVILSAALGVAAAEAALRLYKPRAVMTHQILLGFGVTDADQNWERSADLGWMVKSNATFEHVSPAGEFNIRIRTGPHGLRVPLDETVEDSSEADRTILFVGDSVTAGYEVQYDQTFVALVARTLSQGGFHVRALNAGVRGYSTEQSLKRMDALFRAGLRVTDVVYLYAFNDPFENMSMHFPKRLMTKPGAYLDDRGALGFRILDHELSVLDSEAVFAGPGGTVETLPVIGAPASASSIAERIRHNEPRTILDRSYLYTLGKLVLDFYLVPKRSVAEIRARYPYIVASYIKDAEGRYFPGFIDVSWEPGSYPLRLLEHVVTGMKSIADARGVRFWVALPLTSPETTLSFFKEMADRDGIAVMIPTSIQQKESYARCGGTLTFRIDGHFSACGHKVQAEAISAALRSH